MLLAIDTPTADSSISTGVFISVVTMLATVIAYFIRYIWARSDSKEAENSRILKKISEDMVEVKSKMKDIDVIKNDVNELKGWKRIVDFKLKIDDDDSNNR